jgi:ABC-2 type transport system ATP-binding protein
MLTASHLTRRFGSRLAVEDVSLAIASGEIVALLGPNGAGKTTTLRMLAGLIPPSAGQVHLDGVAMSAATAPRLRRRIGFLTEAPGLWDRLTVADNLLVHARLQGVDDPTASVRRALETFGVANRAGDRAAELSKGLRQRVALARALLHEPGLVLLDEPTSGLDPESARDVRALVLAMRREGRAVLISTHNLDEVERVADRVAVLRSSLVALDTPGNLRARLFGHRVRVVVEGAAEPFAAALLARGVTDVRVDGNALSVGLTPAIEPPPVAAGARHESTSEAPAAAVSSEANERALDTPGLVRLLVEAGARVQAVVPDEASIEDVYLRLVQPATAAP